jgi:hypothetical protein
MLIDSIRHPASICHRRGRHGSVAWAGGPNHRAVVEGSLRRLKWMVYISDRKRMTEEDMLSFKHACYCRLEAFTEQRTTRAMERSRQPV